MTIYPILEISRDNDEVVTIITMNAHSTFEDAEKSVTSSSKVYEELNQDNFFNLTKGWNINVLNAGKIFQITSGDKKYFRIITEIKCNNQ
jgi:hypothetical protein